MMEGDLGEQIKDSNSRFRTHWPDAFEEPSDLA